MKSSVGSTLRDAPQGGARAPTQDAAKGASRPGASADHWPELARRWSLSGPPLRVSDEDADAYARVVEEACSVGGRDLRVLLLGVTPEIFRLVQARTPDLRAFDRARAMVENVWPGPRRQVGLADWTALPLADGSRDLALCDGGFHLLSHPEGQARLVDALRRVLAPGGRCAFRLFVPPAETESADDVIDALRSGRIASVNALKMRLAMAIQRNAGDGVRLGAVFAAFHTAEPDAARLSARIGWSVEEIRSIEAYRGSQNRYHFVSVEEASALFCEEPGGFALESKQVPTYTLGERCPIVVFRRLTAR